MDALRDQIPEWVAHRFRLPRHSHGGTGLGLAHRPHLAAMALAMSPPRVS